jgi:hypothetical protein
LRAIKALSPFANVLQLWGWDVLLRLRIMNLITCVGWVESAKPNASEMLGFVPQPNLQKSLLL